MSMDITIELSNFVWGCASILVFSTFFLRRCLSPNLELTNLTGLPSLWVSEICLFAVFSMLGSQNQATTPNFYMAAGDLNSCIHAGVVIWIRHVSYKLGAQLVCYMEGYKTSGSRNLQEEVFTGGKLWEFKALPYSQFHLCFLNVNGDMTLRLQLWQHTAMPLGTLPRELQTQSKPFFLCATFGHGILA